MSHASSPCDSIFYLNESTGTTILNNIPYPVVTYPKTRPYGAVKAKFAVREISEDAMMQRRKVNSKTRCETPIQRGCEIS